MCVIGTSPHTYFEDVVRFGNNVVRVRTQCIGQVNDRPTRDFTIGMYECYCACLITNFC